MLRQVIEDKNFWNWVDTNIRFPNSMVDRIVPAPDPGNRLLIRTEMFNQWVIENDPISKYFKNTGVQFVSDVKPYELAKIRLFNGIHSFLAYYGELNGIEFVADVIKNPKINQYVQEMQENEIAKTIAADFDLFEYASSIRNRISNKTLRHKASQIAMDGSQKLPQRVIATLNELADKSIPAPHLVNVLSTWIKYLATFNSISDPLAEILKPLAIAEKYEEIFTAIAHPLNSIYLRELTNRPLTFST